MPPPTAAPFMVRGLDADGQVTDACFGGSYSESDAVQIAIAVAQQWTQPMGVFQRSDGELRAFIGRYVDVP